MKTKAKHQNRLQLSKSAIDLRFQQLMIVIINIRFAVVKTHFQYKNKVNYSQDTRTSDRISHASNRNDENKHFSGTQLSGARWDFQILPSKKIACERVALLPSIISFIRLLVC